MTVSRYLSRLLIFAVIVFCAAFLVTVAFIRAANAQELSPTAIGVFHDCQADVDPLPGTWVTFDLTTVDGVPFAFTPITKQTPLDSHWVTFDLTSFLQGTHQVTGEARFGTRPGILHFKGTVDCPVPPTTTTTTTIPPTTTTTTTVPTTVTTIPHDTDHAVPPVTTPAPPPSGGLPRTGSSSTGWTLAGFALVAVGVAVGRVRKANVR